MFEIMMTLLLQAAAIYLIAWIIPAVHIRHFGTAIIVALVYSIINFFLGWLLTILSFPLMILTFGLFKIVINAILLWMTDTLVPGFKINGFGWTLVTAVLISVASILISQFI